MKQIVIFASGSGSNAQLIVEYFSGSEFVIFSNRRDAYVLQRASKMNIPAVVFDRADFYENDVIFNQLVDLSPDLIVLAGFLWKVPGKIVNAFHSRIVNIHPALLPKYGGKGMYGENVHRAVIENREKISGITIHYVNENYEVEMLAPYLPIRPLKKSIKAFIKKSEDAINKRNQFMIQ